MIVAGLISHFKQNDCARVRGLDVQGIVLQPYVHVVVLVKFSVWSTRNCHSTHLYSVSLFAFAQVPQLSIFGTKVGCAAELSNRGSTFHAVYTSYDELLSLLQRPVLRYPYQGELVCFTNCSRTDKYEAVRLSLFASFFI